MHNRRTYVVKFKNANGNVGAYYVVARNAQDAVRKRKCRTTRIISVKKLRRGT